MRRPKRRTRRRNIDRTRAWRLRHNRAADTVNREISPDGQTRTVRRTAARSFALNNLYTSLKLGKNTATAPALMAVFDNLRIERDEGGKAR